MFRRIATTYYVLSKSGVAIHGETMKRGWYVYCSDCGAAAFLSRWKWLARLIWLNAEQEVDPFGGTTHDGMLRCGDEPIPCELIWVEGQ